jgi:tetratricopeptide (TPR) repeat protein
VDGDLPRWIQEEVSRVTPKARIPAALGLLEEAARAFAAGRHGKALHLLEEAKEASPRTATIRELLGLSAYRLGRWEVALRELRTFRRLTGETTHMPVEMDVLRALERPAAVEEAWQAFRRIGGEKDTEREARVVYGSFLLDAGREREAWEVTSPRRIGGTAEASELRVWFVAARAAARLGDLRTARRLYEAIQAADPAFPGLDELDRATRTG